MKQRIVYKNKVGELISVVGSNFKKTKTKIMFNVSGFRNRRKIHINNYVTMMNPDEYHEIDKHDDLNHR